MGGYLFAEKGEYGKNSEGEYVIDWIRFVYDFLELFIIIILLTQIIGGLFVDTFDQIREEREEQEEDDYGNCFICGNTRMNIESTGDTNTYGRHIKVLIPSYTFSSSLVRP